MYEIIKDLIKNGYFVGESHLKGKNLEELQENCNKLLVETTSPEKYNFGKALRIGTLEANRDINTGIYKSFTTPQLKKVKGKVFPTGCNFTEIFISHEFTDAHGLERNGYLHFDRIWTFKYFYYLTDVESCDHGPLCVVPRSHYLGQKLRIQDFHKPYEFQRNRIESDYPEIYSEVQSQVTPILGPAGTLIVFNTDLFHMGGKVRDKQERKVCRLHMRKERAP